MHWGTGVVTTNNEHAVGQQWWLPDTACSREKSGGYQGTVSTQRRDSGWVPDTVHAVETGVVATRALSMYQGDE